MKIDGLLQKIAENREIITTILFQVEETITQILRNNDSPFQIKVSRQYLVGLRQYILQIMDLNETTLTDLISVSFN